MASVNCGFFPTQITFVFFFKVFFLVKHLDFILAESNQDVLSQQIYLTWIL